MDDIQEQALLIRTGLDKFIKVSKAPERRDGEHIKEKEAWDNAWIEIQRAGETGGEVFLRGEVVDAIRAELPAMSQIGRMLTLDLSSQLSHGMVVMAARYGLGTAVTAARSLLECMETVNLTPSISGRRKSAMNSLQGLHRSNLSSRDKLYFAVAMLNYADNPRVYWEAEILPSGIIRVRSRFVK